MRVVESALEPRTTSGSFFATQRREGAMTSLSYDIVKLNCSGFCPFKDAPGTSSSVKIVGKVSFFDVLTSLNASFAAIVFESPGSLTSMQCARDVIMQMCYSLLQAKAEGFCQQFFSLSKRVLGLFSM